MEQACKEQDCKVMVGPWFLCMSGLQPCERRHCVSFEATEQIEEEQAIMAGQLEKPNKERQGVWKSVTDQESTNLSTSTTHEQRD